MESVPGPSASLHLSTHLVLMHHPSVLGGGRKMVQKPMPARAVSLQRTRAVSWPSPWTRGLGPGAHSLRRTLQPTLQGEGVVERGQPPRLREAVAANAVVLETQLLSVDQAQHEVRSMRRKRV